MGILSGIFSKWFAPKEDVQLAITLTEFVQKLKFGAYVEFGLTEELLEQWDRDKSFADFNPPDIGLLPHAQLCLVNLILEICLGTGMDDGAKALRVVAYVLGEALNKEYAAAEGLALMGLKWRVAMLADPNSEDGRNEYNTSETDRTVYNASVETARRFVDAMAAGKVEPTDAEMKFFASQCVSLAPQS